MDTRRIRIIVATFVLGAFALVAGGRAVAQDGTPPAQPITDTVLASGMPSNAPGDVLQLERITIAVGAAIPTHVHPGAYAIYVESGSFGFTVIKGEAQIVRAGSTTAEKIEAGKDVIASPGDSLFENGGVVHSARNAGNDMVIVTTAALLTAGMPSLMPSNDMGTPVS
jgi:quercetin dioxygenase-like cupin family protein